MAWRYAISFWSPEQLPRPYVNSRTVRATDDRTSGVSHAACIRSSTAVAEVLNVVLYSTNLFHGTVHTWSADAGLARIEKCRHVAETESRDFKEPENLYYLRSSEWILRILQVYNTSWLIVVLYSNRRVLKLQYNGTTEQSNSRTHSYWYNKECGLLRAYSLTSACTVGGFLSKEARSDSATTWPPSRELITSCLKRWSLELIILMSIE